MSIIVDQLLKHYEGHPVVNNVSLEVADGEFFVLLGPSGSGKSTLLRLIAGLADVESGRVLLHGSDVTQQPPQARGIGVVFQNYALFRHMSVAENIEFPLKIRRVARGARRRRRDELLEMVGLAGLGGRFPQELSGGQQQRVALARALAHRPEVLLLDEPFGALDARIRVDLRRTVRSIQRALRITTIFVTHDQEVALKTSSEALGWPLLGQAVVEDCGFNGSFERLRLRLPRLSGVRPIAPPAPFGGDFVLVEAWRSQHQARRFPLRPGDSAWVGVRRVHALTHPGLSFLLVTDGSAESRPALELGAQLARLAHARVTLVGHAANGARSEEELQRARESIAGGLAAVEALATPDPPPRALAQAAARRRR